MTAIVVNRNYNLQDNELIIFANSLINYLTRDLTDFVVFGLTAEKIAALKTQKEQFEAFPPDISFMGDVMIATDTKAAIREQLVRILRDIALRVEQKWGLRSGQYKRLDLRPTSHLSDDSLLMSARVVKLKVGDYLTDLAPLGLTQAMIDELGTLTNSFLTAKLAQTDAEGVRAEKTIERMQLGNQLYDSVVRYCDMGKVIYEKVNPAKYNCYVIYGPSAGSLKGPPIYGYRPGDFVISWSIVQHATSYDLQYSPDGINWIDAYSGSNDAVQYIPDIEGWAYFRCRARNNNGYGEFSEVLKAGYYQQLPPPSNIKAAIEPLTTNSLQLTWDEVPSALTYKIYTSVVPLGAAANTYELLGKPKVNNFSTNVLQGKRHYFQLTAENTAQWSQRSTAIFIDVE